ncbi:CDT1 A, putative [Theobroma cacao]|uniref:CDT1 A, putative n=1 Tax=Theobroma cacao TaxID=3641 RepID=A0A061DWU4_THECC|nr:CDT1 A, putative [Theobroma cacao]
MSSSDSLQSTPLKSKKSLNLACESPVSKTPEKHASLVPNRARNRGVALSIKEIRQVAQTRAKPPTDQIKSARKQILSWPTESPAPKTSGDRPDKLPEKYEILCEFFDSLDSAIRLIKLKGSMPTFTNISPKIECLTERRFSFGHLAQLKHILPEVIEIKRMLIFDERTSCMKPDLHISIIVDAIDCGDKSKSGTKNLNVRRVFRARLADFLKAHPEGDDIPEDDLPEPFNRLKQNLRLNMIKGPISFSSDESSTDSLTEQQSLTGQGEVIQEETRPQPSNHSDSNSKMSMETLADVVNEQQPVVASHVSQSFRKRFSQKVTSKAQEAVQKCSKVSLQSSNFQVLDICADGFAFSDVTSSASTRSPTKLLSEPTTREMSYKTCLPATPVKEINPLEAEDGSPRKAGTILSTPAKLASTPARLMTATPTLQPRKRCYMSPDEVSSSSSNKLVRRPPRTRSLKFDTPVKEENIVDEVQEMAGKPLDDDEDSALSILPESLLHSIREKERKAIEERDPAISRAKRRQQMIACLPKLFNMIHYLFQSIKRSVITKEELMHKIIAGHCEIVDRGEVEEQLKLLLELAPEWISEKQASAGDLLVCINKVSSPESILVRLQKAK